MDGKQLKKTGQQLALFNAGADWLETVMSRLRIFCALRKLDGAPAFRFEEFVDDLRKSGCAMPPSSNAFGALPRLACKAGLIEFTGRYENAKSPRTRSHPVKVWRAV